MRENADGNRDNTAAMEPTASRISAYVMLIGSCLLGVGSMLGWLVFLFHGSLNLVNLGLNETGALRLDAFLCLVFFVQHSTMVRKPFRRWLARFVREDYHGALYTIASGIVLLALVIFWQESARTLAAPQGIVRWLVRAVFLLGIAGFNWGTRALGSFDTFGIQPILRHLRGTDPPPPMPFRVRGPYRWVRHPLYLFSLMMIWSCPDLTVDRLLYNVLWTVWVVVATVLEERDLVAAFGHEYSNYQRKVPMLIPYRFPAGE